MVGSSQSDVLGAVAVKGSRYGKPNRAVHYSFALCNGDEQSMSNCQKVTHSLTEGRSIYTNSQAAGVICTPTYVSCNDKIVTLSKGNECTEGRFQLNRHMILEYCHNGHWSIMCVLTHKEAAVACYQLGHTAVSCKSLFYEFVLLCLCRHCLNIIVYVFIRIPKQLVTIYRLPTYLSVFRGSYWSSSI